MKPITMKEWTTHRGVGEIADLSAVRGDDGALYSLWRPSLRELWRMICGHPVTLGVLSQRQPPVTVAVGADSIPGAVLVPTGRFTPGLGL
jgi:hypothetical protein